MDNKFPDTIILNLRKMGEPRYGENPQQEAAIYEISATNLEEVLPITNAEQLNGKPMSFNNWIDADAALKMVWQFKDNPFVTVNKHANPAGACENENFFDAYKGAWNCDPVSAFGGIAGTNRKITKEVAEYIIGGKRFLEAIIAPGYEDDALEILCQKKSLRVLKTGTSMPDKIGFDFRAVTGGFLVQKFDYTELKPEDLIYLEDKGIKKPTEEQIEDMLFGWKVNRRTKSNTVLLVKDKTTIGIGAGQQNRVDAAFIGCWRANKPYNEQKSDEEGHLGPNPLIDLCNTIGLKYHGRTKNSVAVSSAFYPFPDSLEVLSQFGLNATLSPAGSIRDELSYEAMKRLKFAAAHTPMVSKGGYEGGVRAFLH